MEGAPPPGVFLHVLKIKQVAAMGRVSVENTGLESTQNEHLRDFVSAENKGVAALESVSKAKPQVMARTGRRRLPGGTGRRSARNPTANIKHYNMGVNCIYLHVKFKFRIIPFVRPYSLYGGDHLQVGSHFVSPWVEDSIAIGTKSSKLWHGAKLGTISLCRDTLGA